MSKARKMRAWLAVETVMAHAPASSWRCDSSGDMLVLPWGESDTPLSSQNRATVLMLWARALSEITITGNMKSSAKRLNSPEVAVPRSAPPATRGQPLYCHWRSALATS